MYLASSKLCVAISAAAPSLRTSSESAGEHDGRGVGIEIAGGLVGQDQDRLVDHGAGDGDALLLAAGKLRRLMAHPLREPHHAKQPLGLGLAPRGAGRPAISAGSATLCSASNSGSR